MPTPSQRPSHISRSRDNTPELIRTGEPNTERTLHSELSKRCVEVIQEFRSGRVMKPRAILELRDAISKEELSRESVEQSFGIYLDMLDNFEQQQSAALAIGSGDRGGTSTGAKEGSAQQNSQQEHAPVQNKRGHADIQLDSDEDEDAYGTGESCSRRHVDPELCPWLIEVQMMEKPLSESLERTRTMLANFSIDSKLVRSSIVNIASCPPFPETEWMHIVSEKAVDLDQVLTAFTSTSNSAIHKEKVDGIEFTLLSAAPAKTAYQFIFPHRLAELNRYAGHINWQFAAVHSFYHDKIILYDKAIRTHVASCRHLALDDFAAFNDL
ncbi:hypothetical protein EW146_g6527 [Bondarzewia mesenterica]|uniref:Uncharacterized protein n=1 Tax=Bondarzewia mesenterica TaxID=1095465 RepID=A0A4S4LNX4_9AGAM|nr:hypothetical protein EW146_g6527 [Bondarzewia mesenterica]